MKIQLVIYKLMVLFLLFQLVGCREQWDSHYDYAVGNSDNTGILAKLSTLSECSEFYNAVIEAKIDTGIRDNFIYTVLAPINDKFDIESIPEESRGKYLLMHFTHGKYNADQLVGKRLKMFSSKFLNFEEKEGGLVIDNYANIITSDILLPKGAIHTIDTTLVYKRNVYEYMGEEFPFINDHFKTKIVPVFDEENSIPTGKFDEMGRTIYDTAWIYVNTLLYEVADLSDEQAQYTLIIPTKEVVDEAMENDVAQYFGSVDKVPPIIYKSIVDGIIGNSVFPTAYTFDQLPGEAVSVNYKPQSIDKESIFEKDAELSNGILHKTNTLKIDNTSFLKTIQIDFRDYATFDRQDGSLDFYIENFYDVEGDNRHWDVSNHSPESIDINVLYPNQNGILIWIDQFHEGEWIEFEIPNVLKTKYDVWFRAKGGFYVPMYRVQFRGEDGSWEEETFEFLSNTTRQGKVVGTVDFESFGNKTVRFTAIEGGGARKTTTSLYELRLIPVTN